MKIALGQIASISGDIERNIERHCTFISVAAAHQADFVVFPELSLTGYEPVLVKKLAIKPSDQRLDVFQRLSDQHSIVICLSAPLSTESLPRISMFIFTPNAPLAIYSKQCLHVDEHPYFSSGTQDLLISVGSKIIAPAICYEAFQPTHVSRLLKKEPDYFLASVAKDQSGIHEAYTSLSNTAQAHHLPTFMVNGVGSCTDFKLSGSSAVWNTEGILVRKLSNDEEALLIFDTNSHEASCIETN